MTVFRENPKSCDCYIVITHCAFNSLQPNKFLNLIYSDCEVNPVFIATIHVDRKYEANLSHITGLKATLDIRKSDFSDKICIERQDNENCIKVTVADFPLGSVLVMKKTLKPIIKDSLDFLHSKLIDAFRMQQADERLTDCIEKLSLLELNILLYKSNEEESEFIGGGCYDIPGYGKLSYCGIEGVYPLVKCIIKTNDLGHSLCNNVRDGTWLMDYIIWRLDKYSNYVSLFANISSLKKVLEEFFNRIKLLPPYLHPKYLFLLLKTIHKEAKSQIKKKIGIKKAHPILLKCLLGSVQLIGVCKSTGLHPTELSPSLAAGLPHFATNYMRCWGRDIFIAFKGMFLLTKRFAEAKDHICSFASVVRHGMIPNLLDSARKPRYNSRDSTWWFLCAIKDYVENAPQGIHILKEKIKRRFHDDYYISLDHPMAYKSENTLSEIIYEILQKHAQGIDFREEGAGPNLDHAMSDEGFHIKCFLSLQDGFIYGGNAQNCGTWMDKMGDSRKAGNYGIPATPRDGADVEIIGLLASFLHWINSSSAKILPFDHVIHSSGRKVTFFEWEKLLISSFEAQFFVDENQFGSTRGFYKDTFGSSKKLNDFKCRPNYLVALSEAPFLFNQTHAREAIKVARNHLFSYLGMKTLSSNDSDYRANYDNENDGDDFSVAHGFNYHQGPVLF